MVGWYSTVQTVSEPLLKAETGIIITERMTSKCYHMPEAVSRSLIQDGLTGTALSTGLLQSAATRPSPVCLLTRPHPASLCMSPCC